MVFVKPMGPCMFFFPRIILEALGGALVVGLLWLLLNGVPGNPQPGWLERQPWPISSLPTCLAAGAALGLLQALTRPQRPGHTEKLADTAARLRLQLTASVERSDLGGAANLRLFGDWAEASNRFHGVFEGLDLQMLDFTPARGGGMKVGVESPPHAPQTVVVFSVPSRDWPIFEIHPRGMSTWAWDLLGCRGATFRFRDEFPVIDLDRSALARFNRRYRVFVSLAERIAELAGLAAGLPLGARPAQEAELAERFTMSTLRRFAETHGWTVESCSSHVAFWRQGKVLPASEREAFLQQAGELYRSLAAPAKDAADANLVIEAPEIDSGTWGRKMSGLIAGALSGMLAAVVLCVPLLLAMPDHLARVFVFAWPFVGFAFMALGAYTGVRLAAVAPKDR
jgi:hypothetical protein